MVELIKSGKPYEAHPAIWAPFALVGEGGSSMPLPLATQGIDPAAKGPPAKGPARAKAKTRKQKTDDWKTTIWKQQ